MGEGLEKSLAGLAEHIDEIFPDHPEGAAELHYLLTTPEQQIVEDSFQEIAREERK